MRLNTKQHSLLELLMNVPPDLNAVEQHILENGCLPDDMACVCIEFVVKCHQSYLDDGTNEHYVRLDIHDKYIYKIVELFLKHGMDPNAIYGGQNVMHELKYIRSDYVAADTLALLLKNGGDIYLTMDSERLFDMVDFDVVYDAMNLPDRNAYDNLVHYWMVMVGYGAEPLNGTTVADVFEEYNSYQMFDLAKLKNHRNYSVCITNTPGRGENWSLHIIDNNTLWEVARL